MCGDFEFGLKCFLMEFRKRIREKTELGSE